MMLRSASLSLLLLFSGSASILAQISQIKPPAHSAAKRIKTSFKSPNVKFGELVSFDSAKLELILNEKNDIRNTYTLTDTTQWMQNRKTVKIDAFKPGDKIVLHLHKIRGENAKAVSEVADSTSWNWLTTLKKEISAGVLKVLSEDSIEVLLPPDNSPFTFSISEKSRFMRDGKSVSLASFKAGDHIYILPRSLPSGKVMARGVANSEAGAVLLKERLKTSLAGTLQSIDTAAHTITVFTASGDHRKLSYSEAVNVWMGTNASKIADLQPGIRVKLRIQSTDTGEELITEIKKVETASKRSTRYSRKRTKSNLIHTK